MSKIVGAKSVGFSRWRVRLSCGHEWLMHCDVDKPSKTGIILDCPICDTPKSKKNKGGTKP